ncbi:MAG: hypothetical protein LUP99_01535 [Methanomicrobiales archaeon]|nr:hypothetical protein [Methanomicrobiales archaeon]
MNFASFIEERRAYNSLAVNLVTSVNVDSRIAADERKALLSLAADSDRALARMERRCLICGGHGAISILEEGKLHPYGPIQHCLLHHRSSDTLKK